MNPTAPPPTLEEDRDPSAPVFPWEQPSQRLGALALLLVVSLLGHAVSFYVLQVAYTPTASLLPPPGQVTLLPPDSPESRDLDRWLSVVDPALMTQPAKLSSDAATLAAPAIRYVPSYAAAPPAFRSLETGPVSDAAMPLAPVFGSAPLPPFTAQPPRPPPKGAEFTRLDFTGALDALVPRPLPPVRFSAAARDPQPLEPTVYLVGVPAGGGAPFLFLQPPFGNALQTAGGNSAANEYARDYLARLTFLPSDSADAAPVWGWATFQWGNEVYH